MKQKSELRRIAFTDKAEFRFCIERADLEAIRAAAHILDTSAGELVRELIRAYLESHGAALAQARAAMEKSERKIEPTAKT